MKLTPLISCTWLLLPIFAHAKEVEYVNFAVADTYNHGSERFRIDTTKATLASADSIDELDICDANSEYICFFNLAIAFAVPRSGTAVGQAWMFGSQHFSVIRSEVISIMGQDVPVQVICADRGSARVDYFYYSRKRGLLAIKHHDKVNDRTQFFVTTSARGF